MEKKKMIKKEEDKGLRVKRTPAFKLKDKPGRKFQMINLYKQFGFVPETIIIEKVMGHNNALVVLAVMTDEAIKEEELLKSEIEIGQKKV